LGTSTKQRTSGRIGSSDRSLLGTEGVQPLGGFIGEALYKVVLFATLRIVPY
jgi:hypothetical protein